MWILLSRQRISEFSHLIKFLTQRNICVWNCPQIIKYPSIQLLGSRNVLCRLGNTLGLGLFFVLKMIVSVLVDLRDNISTLIV